jgi:hypothetical protein
MSDPNQVQNTDRRDFLLKLGAGAGFVAITAQAAPRCARWCRM